MTPSQPSLSPPADLSELKRRIAERAYVVQPDQVADALLRRGGLAALRPAGARSRRS